MMSDELEADVGRVLAAIGAAPFSYRTFASIFEEDAPAGADDSPPHVLADGSDTCAPERPVELEPGTAPAPAPEPCTPLFDLLSTQAMSSEISPFVVADAIPLASVEALSGAPDAAPSSDDPAASTDLEDGRDRPHTVSDSGAAAPRDDGQHSAFWSAWPAPRPAPWRPPPTVDVAEEADSADLVQPTHAPGPLSLASHLEKAADPDPPEAAAPKSASPSVDVEVAAVAPSAPETMFRVLGIGQEPARSEAPSLPPSRDEPSLFRRL